MQISCGANDGAAWYGLLCCGALQQLDRLRVAGNAADALPDVELDVTRRGDLVARNPHTDTIDNQIALAEVAERDAERVGRNSPQREDRRKPSRKPLHHCEIRGGQERRIVQMREERGELCA